MNCTQNENRGSKKVANWLFSVALAKRSRLTGLALLAAAAALLPANARAAVQVTPASGGTGISADNAANASGGGTWTTLGAITIAEPPGGTQDFAPSQTSVTLILTAPSGWKFNAGQGSVGFTAGRDITTASISVAASTVTVTFSTGAGSSADTLNISNLQIKADDGANLPSSGTIFRTVANPGTASISAIGNNTTIFGNLSQTFGAVKNLIVTLPSQTFTDASTVAGSGNSGTVINQTAGTPFNLALTAVDQFLNIVTSYSGAKTLSYSGPGTSPATCSIAPSYTTSVTFSSGVAGTVATTLTKAQTTTITASDTAGGGPSGPASSSLTVVAGSATQVLVETAADGSGTIVPAQPINTTPAAPLTAYAISRDADCNFITNVTGAWSLTGTLAPPGDLVVAGDTKSATYTAVHCSGSGKIHVVNDSLASVDSGTLTVTDNTPPSIACPASFSVQCTADVPPAYPNLAAFMTAGGSASDNCSSPLTFSLTSDSGLVGGSCGGTVTRVYRVTDAAANYAECTQVITVHDTIAPTATQGTIAACYQTVSDANAAALTATTGLTDNCDPSPTKTVHTSAAVACSTSVIIRVQDSCGNFTDYTYNTRVDGTPPTATQGTIAACYPDVASANAAALAATTALTDNCDLSPTKAVQTSATVACSTTVTIRVQDSCGNFTDYTYPTRVDNTPPTATQGTIAACYPDVASANAAALAATTALTDNCDLSPTKAVQTSATVACSTMVTIRVQDSCGNFTDYTYPTRVDNTPPTATQGTIAACYPDVASANAAALAATTALTDNCDLSPTKAVQTSATVACSTTVTIRVSDSCGNFTDYTYPTRVDNTPPTATQGTIDACYPTVAAANQAALDATTALTDNCDLSPTKVVQTSATAACSTSVIIRVSDSCGNFNDYTYNTRVDGTAPVVTGPVDRTVECGVSLDPNINVLLGFATATDNCDPSPAISHTDYPPTEITPGNMGGWSFYTTDDTGALGTGTGTGSMVNGPGTPPIGTGSANLKTGPGAGDGSVQLRTTDWAGTRLADLTTLQYRTYVNAWNGPGGQATYLTLYLNQSGTGSSYDDRIHFEPVYSAAGAGNGNLNPQPDPTTNTWQTWDALKGMWYSDNGMPNSVQFPADQNSYGDHAITLATYLALYPNAKIVDASTGVGGFRITSGFASPSDNFDVNVDAVIVGANGVSKAYDFDLTPGNTCANTVLVRQWQATDSCGNSGYASQLIRVQDTTPPTITVFPSDQTVSCANLVPPANDALVTATDTCSTPVTVTHDADVITGQTCPNRYTITRTYHATDACGNVANQNQIITVNDIIPPAVTGFPSDATVQCAGAVPPADDNSVAATDNCGGSVTVTHDADVITGQTCANRYTITRTYHVADSCGNVTDRSQTITVNDTTPPTFTCPANIQVSGSAQPVNFTCPTATDNCGGTPTVNCTPASGSTFVVGTTPVLVTATDACGNSSSCTFYVTVCPTANPDVFVDHNYTQPNGTPVNFPYNGSPGPHTIGCDAFATIQAGVNAVAVNGRVHVAAGTYAENVVVSKALLLKGANAGVDPRTACGPGIPRGAESIIDGGDQDATVALMVNDVTVDGFTIQGGGGGGGFFPNNFNCGVYFYGGGGGVQNDHVLNNIITNNDAGVGVTSAGACSIRTNLITANNGTDVAGGIGILGFANTTNLTIADNELTGHTQGNPINLQASGSDTHGGVVITRNNIHDNGPGVASVYLFGTTSGEISQNQVTAPAATCLSISGGNNGLLVTNNFFSDADRGVRVNDPFSVGNNSNIRIHGNSLTGFTLLAGTTYAVGNEGGLTESVLDSSGNWWGVNTPTGVPGVIDTTGGPVDYTPWLDTGVEPVVNVCDGFQGNFHTLHVDDSSPQSGLIGRIQEGINLTSGSTVIIEAGTYTENILANVNNLELAGVGQALVTIVPALSNPNCGPGSLCGGVASSIILVQADNVTIHDMTLDGNNPANTSGVLSGGVDVEARNGIIEDFNLGVFNGTTVSNTTVKNIYLRGIYVSSGGTGFNIHDNTVQNVQGDASSVAIFNFGGSGVIANNTVSSANDAISANWSTGTTFQNNTVSNSGSGVHTDNNGGNGGLADVLQGNTVVDGTAGAYGVFVFAPYLNASVSCNTISNVAVGLGLFGQQAAVTPVFADNTVLGNLDPAGAGVYVSSSLLGFGSSDVSGIFGGNIITNTTAGFYLESEAGYALTVTAFYNSISGNTVGLKTNDLGGSFAVNAVSNWWGSATGPLNAASNPFGTGNAVVGSAAFSPWLGDGTDTSVSCGFQPNTVVYCLPQINSCPANVHVNTGPGRLTCDQSASWDPAAASEPCSPSEPITIKYYIGYVNVNSKGTQITSPYTFPVGPTTVTTEASDTVGNVGTCQFTVTVHDTTPPVVTTVAGSLDRTKECSDTAGIATAVALAPTATDNCGAPTIHLLSDVTTPGACPQAYSRVRTWNFTDAAGNSSANFVQTITVQDTTAPNFAGFPADQTIECSADGSPAGTGSPTGSDNCDLAPVISHADSTNFIHYAQVVEIITRHWRITDACGNHNDQNQTITVQDTIPPIITFCPTNRILVADTNCSALMPDLSPEVVTTDNCTNVTILQDPAAGSILGEQDYHVTITAIDGGSNYVTCEMLISVQDHTPPTITLCPTNRTLAANASCQAAIPDLTGEIEAFDNCSFFIDVTQSPLSGTLVTLGNTVVTISVVDDADNTNTCQTTITVTDQTPPMITGVPAETTVECSAVTAGAATLPASDNCDGTVTAASLNPDQTTPGGCTGRYLITRTWTATDFSGNSSTATQLIHVVDTTPPMITGVPAETTMECSAVTAGAATLPASDNCDGTVTAASLNPDQTTPGGCTGRYLITRTWTATDSCGNSSTATQLIHVVDTTPPMITGVPAETTMECSAVTAGAATLPASDNCDGTVTAASLNPDQTTPGGCTGRYLITRTWTATDSCGNSSTATQLIHVVDTTPPMITGVPAETTMECSAVTAGAATLPASDNCDGTVTAASLNPDQTTPGGCTGRYLITRTWTATDSCGNSSTATQLIHVVDTTPPMITGVPAETTMECSAVTAGAATLPASDNCDGTVTAASLNPDQTTPGGCTGRYLITRTWTATDSCGNSSTATQLIHVVDTTPPMITGVPAETTMECSAVTAGAATLPASDNCDGTVTAASLNPDQTTPGGCTGRYLITRTWTATDSCGNSSTATQLIHVVDTTPPMITGVPAETTMECSAVTAGAATLPASDNCDGTVTAASLNPDQTTPGGCTGQYLITRTWTATDSCGNSSTATQLIHVVDTTPPMITGVPAETTMECSAVTAGAATLPASDNCDGTVTAASLNPDQTTPGGCTGRYLITRTWTATDSCGNSSTATQLIHVVDTTPPMITGVPAETTMECSAVTAGAATLPASDNCDGTVTAASLNPDQTTPGGCTGRYLITRTWTATDSCGNSSTATQLIHVVDTTPPMITGVPAETTMECSAVTAGAATLPASDNCDGTVTAASLNPDQTTPGGCTGQYLITRTWTATDSCGNSSTATQLIHVVDTTPPMITGVPAETTVECSAVTAGAATLPASDNCDGTVTAASLNPDQTTPGGCTGRYLITRTWTATDSCGNSSTATQLIHVVDTTPPMITGVPAETTMECSAVTAGAATLPASDNCDGTVTAASLNPDQTTPGGCTGRYLITRTWTATDSCGNSSTATQLIHVVDTTPPMITGVPAETTMECSAVTAGAATLPASDNCDGTVTAASLNPDQTTPGGCTGRYLITRTWTATDSCGNSSTATQLIHVVDTTPPMITGVPAETTMECSAVTAGAATLPASDNCDGTVTAASLNPDQTTPGGCTGRYLITRTWTATDSCGNSSTATQLIHVVDTTPPMITGVPAETTMECSAVTAGAATLPASDNCDGTVTAASLNPDQTTPGGCTGRYLITRTWTATDSCGNSSTATQLIHVVDTTPPMITGVPAETTMECSAVTAGAATLPASDNCDGTVTAASLNPDQTTPGGCTGRYLITRTWTATDSCGNSSTATQLIHVVDTTPPMITGVPAETTMECSAVTAGAATLPASDNCDGTVTAASLNPDQTTPGGCTGRYLITRTWTATDSCGNSSTATQLIHVVDTTPPVVTAGTIALCYQTVTDATNAALAATTASDTCDTVTLSAGIVGTCSATITVTATDACGNSASVKYNTRIDNAAPVVGTITATEVQPDVVGVVNVFNCANNTVQGTVNISVVASDNCSLVNGHPSISLTNGANTATAVFVSEGPIGTFNYTWAVGPATANGTWTATVAASDLCNTTTATCTLCVDNSQVTGQVQLEGFVGTGTSPLHSRIVTFVASTNNPTFGTNILATWSLLLTNVSGDTFNYTLTGVPLNANHLSAKTAWNLRSSLPLVLVGGQASGVNFTGIGVKQLRGGDLTGDNTINFLDYSILGNNWFTVHAVADINGDGFVGLDDYTPLSFNWFTNGDTQ